MRLQICGRGRGLRFCFVSEDEKLVEMQFLLGFDSLCGDHLGYHVEARKRGSTCTPTNTS